MLDGYIIQGPTINMPACCTHPCPSAVSAHCTRQQLHSVLSVSMCCVYKGGSPLQLCHGLHQAQHRVTIYAQRAARLLSKQLAP